MSRLRYVSEMTAVLAGLLAIWCVAGIGSVLTSRNERIEVTLKEFPDFAVDVHDDLPVDLVFEVINHGSIAVGPFELHTTCQCQVKKELPQSLAPGSRGQFVLHIVPPSWGHLELPFEVSCGVPEMSRVSIPLQIRNTSSHPRIIHSPSKLEFIHFRVDDLQHEIHVQSIEPASIAPVFDQLQVNSPSSLSVKLAGVENTATNATGIQERRYTYSLENRGRFENGTVNGLLWWPVVSLETSLQPRSIPFSITVQDPIFAAPVRLALNRDRPRGQVQIVRRSRRYSVSDIIVESFEDLPITVSRQGIEEKDASSSVVAVFDIAVESQETVFQGSVRFLIEGDFPISSEVELRFDP
jgi:hypothetical protein